MLIRPPRILALFSLSLVLTAPLQAADSAPGSLRQKLERLPEHPRLFLNAQQEAAVRAKIASDPQLKAVWEAVQLTADHVLGEKPVVYRKDGRRLLGRSREALGRMMHLAFAYRFTGETKYVERAVAEMRAMAAMPDWNPSHFLDTAEMTMAMAIGYDWFYDKLSPELKDLVREAIEIKGLNTYLRPGPRPGWERGRNNWNQVCHAGMVAGALALAEINRDRASEVIQRAIDGLPSAMKVYDPDGTYPEGPGYWNYGTSFNVMLLTLLESSLDTDLGLSQSPGFLKAGEFMLQIMGPSRQTFNFSDCGTGTGFSPAMTWFATRTGRPDLLWYEMGLLHQELEAICESRGGEQGDRYFPLVLVWAKAGLEREEPKTLNWLGHGQNPIAVLRSSWTDSNAAFVGIKAGTPSASHGHMDIGSFILDADGVRWALDLGMQNYNDLEQQGFKLWDGRQGGERWAVFRYHTRAHSTLLVNDGEQVVTSQAPIAEFSPDPRNPFAVVDMTGAYAGQLAAARRRFSLDPKRRVTIEDQLTGTSSAADVRWSMVTQAVLKPDGPGKAWLEQNGKRLRLEVLSPQGVTLKSWPADSMAREHDAPNRGVNVIGFNVPVQPGQKTAIKVVMIPGGA